MRNKFLLGQISTSFIAIGGFMIYVGSKVIGIICAFIGFSIMVWHYLEEN